VIRGAALGSAADRETFARHYLPIVRAYLAARWRGSGWLRDIDDTVQNVFVECFRHGGALARIEPGRGFRPFLYGIVRNVARRVETDRPREVHADLADLDRLPDDDESQSRAFDRAWARGLLREAAALQEQHARQAGSEALRRVELLRLRFHDGLPIREVAGRWNVEPAVLHREYARARQEFRAALVEVIAFHHPGPSDEIEHECVGLLALLG
jgi:RNA polymerase sigma-70 factor (ECF subfamily)